MTLKIYVHVCVDEAVVKYQPSFSWSNCHIWWACFRYRKLPSSFGVQMDATVSGDMKFGILSSFLVHNESTPMLVREDPKGCVTQLHRDPTEVFTRFFHSSLPRDYCTVPTNCSRHVICDHLWLFQCEFTTRCDLWPLSSRLGVTGA